MKNRLFIAATFLLSFTTAFGPFSASAQSEPYALLKVGSSAEFVTRNAKGAITDYQVVKVTGSRKVGDTLVVTQEMTILDKNHKPNPKFKTITSHLKVIDGQVIDNSFTELVLNSVGYAIADYKLTDEQKKEVEMNISGEVGRLPAVLTTGTKLPDSKLDFSFVAGKIVMHIKNYGRKVLGTDKVTTPAGTFDCVMLEEYYSINVMVVSEKTRQITWYAPGIGDVKTESWDKGKKSGYPDSITILNKLQTNL